jgi:hypothetical protein
MAVKADSQGHAQILFNVTYLPTAVKHGPARGIALITARAFLSDGTTAGVTKIRFAVQR